MDGVLIVGNTYPVKDQLAKLGGKWNAESKGWVVPESKANEAKELVANAPAKPQASEPKKFVYHSCKVCGAKAWNGRRGRYSNNGVIIYRSGECKDCFEERKMGY